MAKFKVMVIDDHEDMRALIRAGLERDGYEVAEAADGSALAKELLLSRPDAFLLDIVLANETGLGLIAKIREHSDAPIIVVSGKSDLVDKLVGLEMGCDDYIAKPFEIKELNARVKAQIRRYHGQHKPANSHGETGKVNLGDWTLDRARYQAYSPDNRSANLTLKEFKLLEVFALSPGQILTREQLLDRSRDNDFNVTDRAIDTQIVRLRKKLEMPGQAMPLIQAVRGVGYMT